MTAPEKKKIFTWEVIFSTIMLCSSGTFSIMSLKIQGTTYTFKHSMLQTFLMFLGEYLNLLYFAIPLMVSPLQREAHFNQLRKTAIAKNRKLKYTKLWAALPCLLDAVGSGMSITSLLLLPASVCQMLQGGQIVTVCLFSKWINDRPILKHHGAGVALSSIGFIFVGLAGYIAAKGEQNSKYTVGGFIMGIIFIVINLIFQAVQSNVEERIMTKFAGTTACSNIIDFRLILQSQSLEWSVWKDSSVLSGCSECWSFSHLFHAQMTNFAIWEVTLRISLLA